MTETDWVNQRGICADGKHPYKSDDGRWFYPQERTAIRKLIKSNGTINYEFVCTVHGCRWKSSPISTALAKIVLGKLPVLETRRSAYAVEAECGYVGCESTEVEWHHYAPRNTFGQECDNFPCLPLCRMHHRYWHQQMNGYQWNRRSGIDCDGCGATAQKGHQCFCVERSAV